MSKRNYTHMNEYEAVILTMRQSGCTRREIADELGLSVKQIETGDKGTVLWDKGTVLLSPCLIPLSHKPFFDQRGLSEVWSLGKRWR